MLRTIRRKPEPEPLLDRRGYTRSPVTLPSYRKGKAPANKGRTFPPEPLTAEEVYRLIDACDPETSTGRRNRAVIRMFWRTGLRCAELCALLPRNVDLEAGAVTVLRGKGGKRRVVAIDPEACGWLAEWEAERVELGLGRDQAYFCVLQGPSRGEALHDAYIREFLRDLRARAGIERRVAPHQLRHSYATYLMETGIDLKTLQTLLGHSSLAITEKYLHLNPARALREARKIAWPVAA